MGEGVIALLPCPRRSTKSGYRKPNLDLGTGLGDGNPRELTEDAPWVKKMRYIGIWVMASYIQNQDRFLSHVTSRSLYLFGKAIGDRHISAPLRTGTARLHSMKYHHPIAPGLSNLSERGSVASLWHST